MGLFDNLYGDPNQAGLFGLAQGLLQAGGPQRVPMGFAGALGQGIQGGMQAAQAAQTYKQQQALQALHQNLIGAQIGNYGSEDMARKAQMAETQRKAADQAGLEQTQKDANDYALAELAKRRTPPNSPPDQNDVTATIGNPTADPQYHEYQSQYYSKKGYGKLAIDSAKEAMALRKELADKKPLMDDNYIVGKDEIGNPTVQAHQSFDNGKTWQPRPGSLPGGKFSKTPLVNATIENYPNPIPVTDAKGKTKMVQFGKKGEIKETPYVPPQGQMNPTAAGQVASMRQASKDITDAETLLFPNDTFDRSLAGAVGLPGTSGMPFNTNAKKVFSALYNASDVILRMRTGAAAPEKEVTNMARTFMPSVTDTKESAKYKLQRLRIMLDDALKMSKGSGQGQEEAPDEDPLGIRK